MKLSQTNLEEVVWLYGTVNVDIFAHQALRGVFAWLNFQAHTSQFYFFYYRVPTPFQNEDLFMCVCVNF